MSNAFSDEGNVWTIDSTGNLDTTPKLIQEVVFVPALAADDLIISDTSDNTLVVLKAGAADASPVHVSFSPARRVPSVKVKTIDGGTAYVYYATSRH
jgi:hypothetical protein